jgi:hypothetical protein
MANRHALSPTYKTLEISPTHIRGAAPYGILEMEASLGISETIWVDALSFCAVVKSLSAEELGLSVKAGALHWECGLADGKLALLGPTDIPKADWSIFEQAFNDIWQPPPLFATALELGALSAGPQSMASAGVFGVVIDNRPDGLAILSSDNVTISNCAGGEFHEAIPSKIVLVPEAAILLGIILGFKSNYREKEPARLDLDDKAIFCQAGPARLMLRPAPPLRHDIRLLSDGFAENKLVAPLPAGQVAAFIRRAGALAESRQNAHVKLAAASGALSLSFLEGAAASDEYYIVEGLALPADLPEIKLDAARIARVLTHANTVVLDHIQRGVLVFMGKDPEFRYMVSGVREG